MLHFTSLNLEASTTVLLIHGAFVSSTDWSLIHQYITPPVHADHHFLIPDLPGHGASSKSHPSFSIPGTVDLLANLIRENAHNSIAHVVGFSLGSLVALQLASSYPRLTSSLLISGYLRIPPSRLTATLLPYGFQLDHLVTTFVPRPLMRYLMDRTDFAPESSFSKDLSHQIATAILSFPPLETLKLESRTLVIAATKGGIVPSHDNVKDAKALLEVARACSPDSRGVQHRLMRHPWNRQDPKLFAETMIAWIEKRELPPGFEDL